MQREEKSERSRRCVLDAALYLFSHHGFRGTSMREISERAGLSTGNMYHHFPDKEAIFMALIDEYLQITAMPRYPLTRVLQGPVDFPDNIEEIGYAVRDAVRQYRSYLALIYVDVIEFGGTHIQRFYSTLTERFTQYFEDRGGPGGLRTRLRANITPAVALIFTVRFFFNYFSTEILFGVREPFGRDSTEVVREIADIVRNGICERD
jgi:AcrR family transcriptional regulator